MVFEVNLNVMSIVPLHGRCPAHSSRDRVNDVLDSKVWLPFARNRYRLARAPIALRMWHIFVFEGHQYPGDSRWRNVVEFCPRMPISAEGCVKIWQKFCQRAAFFKVRHHDK